MTLPKELTTVTTVSRFLTLVLLLSLPFVGFLIGLKYERQFTEYFESRASVDQYILKTQPAATQSASTASPAPNGDRANWKTYKSSNYGYEFKYPSNWKLIETSRGGQMLYDENQNPEGLTYTMSVNIFDANANRVKVFDSIGTKETIADKVIEEKTEDYNLNGMPAAKLKTYILPGSQTDAFPSIGVRINIKSKILTIDLVTEDQAKLDKNIRVFDQILSTFKFD